MNNPFLKNTDSSGRIMKIVAVCAAAVILTAVILVLVFKNSFFIGRTVKNIEKGDINAARISSRHITNDAGQVTGNYVELLSEINRRYPNMLAEFSIDTLKGWRDRASAVKDDENLPEKFKEGADNLYDRLYKACQLYGEYEDMRDDILDMMDVFNEINRLYTTGADGQNITFTIKEETDKVKKWEEICFVLSSFSSEIPDGASIYLLNYLVSETYGECEEIRNQLDRILDKGYEEDDPVRVTGNKQKTFSDVRNDKGVSLSVLNKEEYEEYMYIAVCRALTQSLAEYYIGIQT